MAVNTVRVQINGTWVTLTKNATTGKYEGTIAAPNITSYNVNASHYYPVTVEAIDLASNVTTANDSHATLGSQLKLFVKEVTKPTIAFTAPASGAYLASNTPAISLQLRDETNGSGIKIGVTSRYFRRCNIMTAIQKKIIIAGINIKLERDENLEAILASYVKLTETEKTEVRTALA